MRDTNLLKNLKKQVYKYIFAVYKALSFFLNKYWIVKFVSELKVFNKKIYLIVENIKTYIIFVFAILCSFFSLS